MTLWNQRIGFVVDANFDGKVSISDVWEWFFWLFFIPGDVFLYLIMRFTPSVAMFFELSFLSFGNWFSGVLSFFTWCIFYGMLTGFRN